MKDFHLGKKIHYYRKQKGHTLKSLADEAGVTPSLLSQIEKGSANPSINTLKLISSALSVPLFNFFIEDMAIEKLVVRANQRKIITFSDNNDVRYELLSPNLTGDIEFVLMTINPGFSSSEDQIPHRGEEVAYLEAGQAEVFINDKSILLDAGDSIKIPPHTKHRWINIGTESLRVIFALTPPTF